MQSPGIGIAPHRCGAEAGKRSQRSEHAKRVGSGLTKNDPMLTCLPPASILRQSTRQRTRYGYANRYEFACAGPLLTRHARYRPSHTAVVIGNERLTYLQFNDFVNRWANALAALGVR